MFAPRLLTVLIGCCALLSLQTEAPTFSTPSPLPSVLTQNPLDQRDRELVSAISTSQWLGPLAPIAISPFFGITCLAGLSQYGGDYLPVNQFVSQNPVLQSPAVFWIFLALTIATSLPRLTKVSKPVAQAVDQIEAYAGIITVLVLRFAVAPIDLEVDQSTAMVVQAGFFEFSADVLFSVAAIINIIVINSIKFFFEVLVWLIPVPFVDAILEAGNKLLCAGLMAIYAWSPLVATLINLLLFAICLLAFLWVKRRVSFFRAMLLEPALTLLMPSYGQPKSKKLVVFNQSTWEAFPAKSKLLLEPADDGWLVTEVRWLLPKRNLRLSVDEYQLKLQRGLLVNTIAVRKRQADGSPLSAQPSPDDEWLYLSRRFNQHLDQLASDLRIELATEPASVKVKLV